jgi:NAD(P)-dependent dehydrogenase (short-subunit alcohol dehydrogenase family)
MSSVVAVTGAGGIGMACARRLGSGSRLVLAETNPEGLDAAVGTLIDEGFDVEGQILDVREPDSVKGLVERCQQAGPVATVIHTAGLSPTMAPGRQILEVNLLGTALLIEAIAPLMVEGSVGVFIASMAGHLWPVDAELESRIATAPATDVLAATGLPDDVDPDTAYAVSKRGCLMRIVAAAKAWGQQGARIVSVSPGMVATPMGHQESAAQPIMREMLQQSAIPRLATPTDIAEAVAWLASPAAGFVTGTDLLVDGGVVAAFRGWS